MAAALRAVRNADSPVRTLWLLLVASLLFHSTAMSLDVLSEFAQTPVLNHIPRLQILFSMLYNVPLLVIVSMQSDRRILAVSRAIHALLSISVGAILCIQLFTLLAANGNGNPADALLITRLFDAIDVFLATAATLRWLASTDPGEHAFFRILSIFMWVDTILPAIHNRILLHHDYVWLDLFISTPYIVLCLLIVTARRRPAQPLSPAFVRTLRAGSPIFLTIALVITGVVVSKSNFYLGLAAVLLAIAAYGALNVFTQTRVLESEESLLAAKQTLETLVGMDSLTGIANRRAFDKVFEREFSAARRGRHPVSLMIIDVDFFKEFNDAYGHLAGDECLVLLAATFRRTLPRVTDFVSRFGGEEFAAILPATDSAGAEQTASKMLQSVADLRIDHPAAPTGKLTVSIGLSTFDGFAPHTQTSLVRAADRALYLAKNRGRNRSVFLSLDNSDH